MRVVVRAAGGGPVFELAAATVAGAVAYAATLHRIAPDVLAEIVALAGDTARLIHDAAGADVVPRRLVLAALALTGELLAARGRVCA